MNFTQFKPEELIGRYVLIGDNKIRQIKRVNKATFEADGKLYNLNDGKLRGASIWATEWANLITDGEAAEIKEKWRIAREEKEMREAIIKLLPNLPHDKLTEITALIKP